MSFISLSFAIFFLAVLVVYWAIPASLYKLKNICLLLANYLFYGWWDWRFLGLIMISSGVDYMVGRALEKEERGWARKNWLWVSIAVNLGLLGFFKYANFFIDSWIQLWQGLGIEMNPFTLQIILPVGISFYTFQTMSYTLDVYHRRIEPTKDVLAFFAFVSFFPQLVAGPIEWASHLLPQFFRRNPLTHSDVHQGLRWILWGLVQKVVVADNIGPFVQAVYAQPSGYSSLTCVLATILFGMQIYCDFSGYSLIARGTAKLLGFDLMQNFAFPYLASSLRQFWHRWHISLSTWFRDYVYIPLGGNRKGSLRNQVNILLTFLLSGLWHGANWTFLIWGGVHGVALIIENVWRKQLKTPSWLGWGLTFCCVSFAWLFFRAESWDHAMEILGQVGKWDWGLELVMRPFRFLRMLIGVGTLILVECCWQLPRVQIAFHQSRLLRWGVYLGLLMLIAQFGAIAGSGQAFIYFQF